MSITINGLKISALQSVPYAHAGDALTGRTARRFPVQAILSKADWLTLDNIYTTWRAARLADPDTMVSLTIGSTVSCSGKVYGYTWNNVASWFAEAPQASPAGGYMSVSFELIDAVQQLAVMLREEEISTQIADNESTYGTYTLGTITLNLTGPLDSFEDGPRLDLAATGTHVIRGPMLASKIRRVTGWTHTANAESTIRAWYETQIGSTPAENTYWPMSPPTIEQTPKIINGARITRYLVSADLKQIR